MHIEDLVGVDCARRDLRPRTRPGFVEKLASLVVVVVVVLAPRGTASSPPPSPSYTFHPLLRAGAKGNIVDQVSIFLEQR